MKEILPFLQNTALFGNIPAVELTAMAADFRPRWFEQGQQIFSEGDPGDSLFLVHSGQVRIFVNSVDGTETSVILVGRPGQTFGELALIDDLPRSASAIAICRTRVLVMARDHFRRHMTHSPQLALNFLTVLSRRLRYSTRQVNSLAALNIPRRLARKLVELGQEWGEQGDAGVRIVAPLNQSDLASMIGATRESTNKVLRHFRREGFTRLENGQIVILNPPGLHARST